MKSSKYILSSVSQTKLQQVILAFYHARRDITSRELASENHGVITFSAISGSVGFLASIGVLLPVPNEKYCLSEFGERLAKAISDEDKQKLSECYASIVKEKDVFLNKIYQYIITNVNQNGVLEQKRLQEEIIKRAGRDFKHNSRKGANTIIDIMIEAKLLKRRKQQYTSIIWLVSETAAADQITDAGTSEIDTGTDMPPDFSKLSNPSMREILSRRWAECAVCVAKETPIAALVMIGGLLEALLYFKMKEYNNQAIIFRAKAVPVNHRNEKLSTYEGWTLNNYIAVAHELGWITKTAHGFVSNLMDYRNIIHPYKELKENYQYSPDDAKMSWKITKDIARKLYA